MRAMITGANGFLGRNLVRYLEKKTDWEIVTPRQNLKYPLSDNGKFDYIINLASGSSVEESVKNPVDFVRNNVVLALNVLEYARQHPPKVFLQFSTVEVYNISNPYAASKAAQENIATAYWKTYDVPIVIARSSNIIGPGQSPEKFVPKVAEKVKKGEVVDIYMSQGKQGSRIYNTVENVADAILFLLSKYPHKLPKPLNDRPLSFDIDGGTELTNLEMAKKIAEQLGKELKYQPIEPKSSRPAYDLELRQQGTSLTATGWKPPQTLKKGLLWIK